MAITVYLLTKISSGEEMGQEMDRMQVDWSKYNLAKQSFSTCNTDGSEGLTWLEISECEVSKLHLA